MSRLHLSCHVLHCTAASPPSPPHCGSPATHVNTRRSTHEHVIRGACRASAANPGRVHDIAPHTRSFVFSLRHGSLLHTSSLAASEKSEPKWPLRMPRRRVVIAHRAQVAGVRPYRRVLVRNSRSFWSRTNRTETIRVAASRRVENLHVQYQ